MQFDSWILLMMGPGTEGNSIPNLVIIASIVFITFFFMIRPQTKKAKEQRQFSDSLEKGMQVVTNGGLHGKVSKVEDSTVTLLVDNKTHLTFEKVAISFEMTQAAYGNKDSK